MRINVSRRQVMWCATGLAWLGGIVAGFAWLGGYDNRPGLAAAAPARWPTESRIVLDPNDPTLIMLAHPRCSCTRASLAELAELMARADEPPRAYVIFIRPTGVDDNWDKTGLKQIAAAIPRVTVVRDDDGFETRRFGAATSGQVLLYDAGGTLLYRGGTTGARGHTGDNAGRATILALLNHQHTDHATASVFGCPLFAQHLDEGHEMTAATPHGSDHN